MLIGLDAIGKFFFNARVISEALPYLWSGLLVTIRVGLLVTVLGFAVGLLLALVRCSHIRYVTRILGVLIRIYVDFLRSSPYLVLLVLVYFGLPFVGINLTTVVTTVVVFSACLSAFAEEIFRAAIESIEKGQTEASRALGLSFLQMMRYVIVPQAVRVAIPTLANRTVAITKAISMASAIALPDLLKEARQAAGNFANPSPLIAAAVMYITVFFLLGMLVSYLEKKWKTNT